MTMGDRSSNDRLALSYRDTRMAEIGPVYFPVFSFSPGRLPLSTLEELLLLIHSVCGTREELDIYIYIYTFDLPTHWVLHHPTKLLSVQWHCLAALPGVRKHDRNRAVLRPHPSLQSSDCRHSPEMGERLGYRLEP